MSLTPSSPVPAAAAPKARSSGIPWRDALVESVRKLSPRRQIRNPVMFVVWVGAVLTTGLAVQALLGAGEAPFGFIVAVAAWLWFTVLFANLAEAAAEGRGRAQAAALRRSRGEIVARRLVGRSRDTEGEDVGASHLRRGDVVLVNAGETIPCDGTVIEGAASVDESAVTGES